MTAGIAPRDQFGLVLAELGSTYENLIVLNGDVAKATKTELFGKRFPTRLLNMGICEQNLAGVAAGLARSGLLPVLSTFAAFAPGRCYDQIRQSIAYANVPVKIMSTHPGLAVGGDGAMHQSLDDLALMRVLPNMTVLAPSDHIQTGKAVAAALYHPGPVYVRIDRKECKGYFQEDWEFIIGKAYVLKEGSDIVFIAHGSMVEVAMEAGLWLEKIGISARVIDMPSIKPIDEEALLAAARIGKIITLEDHFVTGGLYSAVCEVICREQPCRVQGLGVKGRFGQSGNAQELYREYGLTAEAVVWKAIGMCGV